MTSKSPSINVLSNYPSGINLQNLELRTWNHRVPRWDACVLLCIQSFAVQRMWSQNSHILLAEFHLGKMLLFISTETTTILPWELEEVVVFTELLQMPWIKGSYQRPWRELWPLDRYDMDLAAVRNVFNTSNPLAPLQLRSLTLTRTYCSCFELRTMSEWWNRKFYREWEGQNILHLYQSWSGAADGTRARVWEPVTWVCCPTMPPPCWVTLQMLLKGTVTFTVISRWQWQFQPWKDDVSGSDNGQGVKHFKGLVG